MCCVCLCASLPGLATPLLCALAAAQTIDFVFFLGYEYKPGGVFREKNFFVLCFLFCLGKIILKFIFDFGIRENKKDELQARLLNIFYVHALSVAVLLLDTAAVRCSITSCKASIVVVALVQALSSVSPEIAESASPQEIVMLYPGSGVPFVVNV
jgi:hypothetical protein